MLLDRQDDAKGALESAKRALELDARNVDVRGLVADLYTRTPGQALLAIEEHRRIFKSGHVRPASINALLRTWQGQHADDRAFVAAEILTFLGMADEGAELFFNDNKKRLKKDSLQSLTPAQVKGWLMHPAQRGSVHEVLALVVPDLGKAFADGDIEPVDRKMVLRPKADDDVRRLADEMALHIGAPAFDVHRSESRRGVVRAFTAQPAVLMVGVDVAKLLSTREQKFLVGKEMLALAAGHTLIRSFDAMDLAGLLTAIGRCVDKTFPLVGTGGVPADLESHTKKISGALSRKTKAALAEPLLQLASSPRVDLRSFLEATTLSEARAGLVVCGAFDAAVRLIAKDTGKQLASDAQQLVATLEGEPRLADLVSFALSDEHFQARQALRLAIDA
jgi:hypothetical protein